MKLSNLNEWRAYRMPFVNRRKGGCVCCNEYFLPSGFGQFMSSVIPRHESYISLIETWKKLRMKHLQLWLSFSIHKVIGFSDFLCLVKFTLFSLCFLFSILFIYFSSVSFFPSWFFLDFYSLYFSSMFPQFCFLIYFVFVSFVSLFHLFLCLFLRFHYFHSFAFFYYFLVFIGFRCHLHYLHSPCIVFHLFLFSILFLFLFTIFLRSSLFWKVIIEIHNNNL